MNYYSMSAICSFILFFIGTISLMAGVRVWQNNPQSKSGHCMLCATVSVFVWDFGYGWMGLCHGDDFAYVPRALALISVIVYMYFVIMYVIRLSDYSIFRSQFFLIPVGMLYFVSWLFIIRKDAVTFEETPWGYWYTSNMSWARVLQFVTVILALVYFYIVLYFWKKKIKYKREALIIKRFELFGPIMFLGYTFDVLMPTIWDIPAVPGSAIAAFASALLLYSISVKYTAFGISVNNVAAHVFRGISVPVLILNEDDEIVLVNDCAVSQASSHLNDHLVGQRLFDLLEDIPEDVKYEVDKWKIYHIKGTERYCKLEYTEVYDEFEEILYKIVFAPDMTGAIESMKLLYESRMLAENASMAKSNFLANMSHEIRTPMNAIIGMSDFLLRDGNFDDETKGQVQNIKDAGNGLLGIINDILDISKIESGKYELVPVDYEMASLIQDVTTVIQVRLQEGPVEFKLHIDKKLPMHVYGDEIRVRQILMNILGNAVKFTKKGSIELSCRAKANEDGDSYSFTFDIIDTGMGIKPEDIDNIFGAFTQVDTRKNRAVQGTGLGLAISKNLAMMMGGDITVNSVYGEGSAFRIKIVQKVEKYEEIGEKVATSLESKNYRQKIEEKIKEVVPRPDKKVLVVDDTSVNLIVAKGLLKPYMMQVDTAESGRKAIEMVKANDYDIVFMDHMMPELDGVDTTHLIRELEGDKFKNLVIVALTANAIAGTRELLMDEGMQDFLAKPIDKNDLNEIIERWL